MEIKKTTQEEINATLWRAADTFRGKIDSSLYKDYILVMLFIKYLSDVYLENILRSIQQNTIMMKLE